MLEEWVCLACGQHIETDEKGVKVCSACGASGRDCFECRGPVTCEPECKRRQDAAGERVLIVGAGGAGFSVAKRLRELGVDCGITLVGAEPGLPYFRPLVTDVLCEPGLEQKPNFVLARREWYRAAGVELKTGTEVAAVDMARREATTTRGERLAFTTLVLATGARNIVPAAGRLPPGNTFGVRTLGDVRRLREYAARHLAGAGGSGVPPRIAVIGGGLGALELADSLVRLGAAGLTVVEKAPRLLPKQLPDEAARVFTEGLSSAGVEVRAGATVAEYESSADGARVVSLLLSDGARLCDVSAVCFAVGARPDVDLARRIGCRVESGVVVDGHMRTTVPRVYACGDCAQPADGTRATMSWGAAVRQGAAVAESIARGACAPPAPPPPYILDAFCGAVSVGRVEWCPRNAVLRNVPSPGCIAQFFFDNSNKTVGAVLVGRQIISLLQGTAIKHVASCSDCATLSLAVGSALAKDKGGGIIMPTNQK